ncbi:putative mitogen-activated protein kinase kinase kinase STE-STE11 family [Dioscorea sansibarensis]
MHDLFGSVRRSLVFRASTDGAGIGEKIGSCLRKSRVGFGLGSGLSPRLPAPVSEDEGPPIRWRMGELIGYGAFGQVYMGMNLDSGELLAVKQVLIGRNSAKEKAQAHIRELEEEVKLLKNLSHPNIVRYLGTAREEETLNILLEFVPGGSISSLLGKFGSFPEAVIKMYSKQLLQGLEYLHKNGIIHRDIKGANILVDNKGCIKLADFGASKQVVKLATMTAAKSMKGTPYWMAPEVILQTGHSLMWKTYPVLCSCSADIWSVGCTIIEMATGKPPWSQQFQEVAALFHIGTTKAHPPIPEHLSPEAKDFLLKCLQKEPNLRPSASDLLKHPFVTGEREDSHTVNCSTVMSFNPISEPFDDWGCKFDMSQEQRRIDSEDFSDLAIDSTDGTGNKDFTVPCEAVGEDDDEVTETKIRAFLDEKVYDNLIFLKIPSLYKNRCISFPALDLKKLQTPLYEEFFNSLNSNEPVGNTSEENCTNNTKLPPRNIKSPSRVTTDASATIENPASIVSPGNTIARFTRSRSGICRILKEIPLQEAQKESNCVSSSFLDRRQKWKEELDQELEMMRQAGAVPRTSPKDKALNRKRDRSRFAFPNK